MENEDKAKILKINITEIIGNQNKIIKALIRQRDDTEKVVNELLLNWMSWINAFMEDFMKATLLNNYADIPIHLEATRRNLVRLNEHYNAEKEKSKPVNDGLDNFIIEIEGLLNFMSDSITQNQEETKEEEAPKRYKPRIRKKPATNESVANEPITGSPE